MQELDLVNDDLDEYEGRLVRAGGAEYIIGPHVGTGGERVVHALVNRRSGLSLLIIKILRDQSNAREIALALRDSYGRLRDAGIPTMLDPELVEGHGGWFELEEAATEESGRVGALMKRAHTAFSMKNADAAEELCRQILAANANHTEALHLMARVAAERGDFAKAIDFGLSILSIEPNIRPYQFTLMEWAAQAGQINIFLNLLEEMQAKWPGEHRINDLAATVLLAIGKPEEAIKLKIPPSTNADNLIRQIREENTAKAAARKEMDKALSQLRRNRDEEAKRHLQLAYRHYRKDLYVVANLGFALLRHGDWKAAHDLIGDVVSAMPPDLRDTCLANMAFALAVGGDYPRAADLLDFVAEQLIGPDGTIAFWDLPGRAVWVEEGQPLQVLMERPERVARLVHQVVDHAAAGGTVPDNLKVLAAAYDRGPGPDDASNRSSPAH